MPENGAPGSGRLSVTEAVAIVLGIIIGAGIFKTPSIVAANAGGAGHVLAMWLVGGLISLVGALCYAELASAFPHAGGDYHFLARAFGRNAAFLFAWARMTIIQAGSIAMLGFIIGDYASEIWRVGTYSSSLYAAGVILLLTGLNAIGIKAGSTAQRILILAVLVGLFFIMAAGLTGPRAEPDPARRATAGGMTGRALIFVLLTYGGWSEAGYLSAEVRDTRRNITRVILVSLALVTLVYIGVNLAYLRTLGVGRMSESPVIAADLMRLRMGEFGARSVSLLIAVAAFSTMNGSIITGARTNYALGRDFETLRFLGRWNADGGTPVNALLAQAAIALTLVVIGSSAREGFVMMVEYTAPIFWFFLFLVGVSVFALRRKYPDANRPFRVPLYPLTPLIFCAVNIYMLRSSLAYSGFGAFIGVAVLLAGLPLLGLNSLKMKMAGRAA